MDPTAASWTATTPLEKLRSEMAYAQQILNQLQTTMYNVNQTLDTMESNSSPFSNPEVSDEPLYSAQLFGNIHDNFAHAFSGAVNGDAGGGVFDWSQASRSDFLGVNANANPGLSMGEDGKTFGSTVTEAGTNLTESSDQRLTPSSFGSSSKRKRIAQDEEGEEEYSFEEYMADANEEGGFVEMEDDDAGGVRRKEGGKSLSGERKGVDGDEELDKDIEMELDRVLYGDENEVERKEGKEGEKARRIRCADGTLRGQYEECP